MNRIDYIQQYFSGADPDYADNYPANCHEGATAKRNDKHANRVSMKSNSKSKTSYPLQDTFKTPNSLHRDEDRDATRALHRLHERTGFHMDIQNPRRRHELKHEEVK